MTLMTAVLQGGGKFVSLKVKDLQCVHATHAELHKCTLHDVVLLFSFVEPLFAHRCSKFD